VWRCFACNFSLVAARAPDACDNCGTLDPWVRALPVGELGSSSGRRARRALDVPPDTTPRLATGTELDEPIGGGLAETSTTLLFGGDGKGKTRAALRLVGGLQSSLIISLEQPVELTCDTARHAGADLRGMDVVEDVDGWELEAEGKRAVLLDSISVAAGWARLLRELREWATKTRGVVICIAQVNARGRVLGPNALRHWPDYVIRVSDGSKPGLSRLTVQKSRYCARCATELAIVK
jgi:predicted ATP-dependent serine protease